MEHSTPLLTSTHVLPVFMRNEELPDPRAFIRTPSPTPSERKALSKDKLSFKEIWETLRDNWKSFLGAGIFITLIALLLVYKDDIVEFLKPASEWMYRTPGAWLIPIILLVVLSFPPLIGHEIVIILSGFAWGLWIGFGITCAGTFFGEIITFYILKLFGTKRWQKMKDQNINYETLERVLQDGGLLMAIIARYSVIPSHILTAIFSACGMHIWTFCVAALLSLPKPFVLVYLGYSMTPSQEESQAHVKDIVKYVALALKVVITIAAMWYVNHQRSKIKPDIVYQRRKRRQIQLQDLANTRSSRYSDADVEAAHPIAPTPRHLKHTPAPSWSSRNTEVKAVL